MGLQDRRRGDATPYREVSVLSEERGRGVPGVVAREAGAVFAGVEWWVVAFASVSGGVAARACLPWPGSKKEERAHAPCAGKPIFL